MAKKDKSRNAPKDDRPISEQSTDGTAPEGEDTPAAAPRLKRVEKPVGEGDGNLGRREDWFRRRSGTP